jgi:hypothetical protein
MRNSASALIVCCLAGTARAGIVEVSVDVAKEIVREDEQSRVVLKVSDLSFLTDQLVRWASLEIPLPQRTIDRDLELFVYPVARSWDAATVSWTTPWQNPGGDWSEDALGHSRIRAGRTATSLRFDVSGIVRAVAEGREANLGFILLPGGDSDGRRFVGNERLMLAALSNATLRVSYRSFPRGVRP